MWIRKKKNTYSVEKVLERTLDIVKESYNQENNRAKALLTKSDYIIKYITSTFVFVNAMVLILINNKMVNLVILVILYFIVGAMLCFSLYNAVKAQALLDVAYFPTGDTILKDLAKLDNEQENLSIYLSRDIISYYSQYIEKLEEANNKRAKILKQAYGIYNSSVIVITLLIFIIILIIA